MLKGNMLSSSSSIGASALQQNATSYSNERPGSGSAGPEIDYAIDPASGGFFHADYKKHDDLKQMLDSNKDSLKLEAMKRIIGMVAKGRDASELFPAVVKNVVSKNIEVKKLVYVYLVRYAEEQQDLALLSISTFQRALKDPNQLIRASALRVLSSIRVSMIVPIVMLAIRESASDMSPYVRKTAAHAIPKLYHLDEDQKDELITVIEKLLSDRTTLVVGSAVMAFEEVCPERVDLIHRNYRKFCNLLVDVDEWGQVIIINMLTRYARTQFVDPNRDDVALDDNTVRPFYDETSSESDSASGATDSKATPKKSSSGTTYSLDLDHRLLLRQTKPLLQSRNASVVMAVAQLYHHVAPRSEVALVVKALIRLLRSHKEVQSVVLTSIASMSTNRKIIFEPFMKSFFVRTNDPTHIKLLKLDILTNLATETSISIILREFQTYISSSDKDFVAATIQAIGRCAASIKEVTDTCLNGLVHLLSNRDEYVVAESVVVIKKLLQTQSTEHRDIIAQMAKLLDFIAVPAARAAILWLIGEYSTRVPKIAPDVLRKLAKSFVDEQDVVKLQILNLAVKLFLTNAEQTTLLVQYVFNLARFDQNYDIRDRARFLRQLILPADGQETVLSKNAHRIFLTPKPAPTLESTHIGRDNFQLGSLSHYLNSQASGYNDLPTFPITAPDTSVRHVESPISEIPEERPSAVSASSESNAVRKKSSKTPPKHSFYSESEKSSSEDSDDENGENEEDDDEEDDDEDDDDDDDEDDDDDANVNDVDNAASKNNKKANGRIKESSSEAESKDSASDSDSSSDDDDESSSDDAPSSFSEGENGKVNFEKAKTLARELKKQEKGKEKSNLDLLLDLSDIPPMTPIMTPSLSGFLTPMGNVGATGVSPNAVELVGPSIVSAKCQELLNKVNGFGLGITYRFTRGPHLFSSRMASVELVLTNGGTGDIEKIKLGEKLMPAEMKIADISPIGALSARNSMRSLLGIDFNDSTQPASFEVSSSGGSTRVSLRAPVGELIRSISLPYDMFVAERAKLRGMTEHKADVQVGDVYRESRALQQRIFETANVARILSNDPNRLTFAGQTMASKSMVLITIIRHGDTDENTRHEITVNCEKMVIGSMLLNELTLALQQSN